MFSYALSSGACYLNIHVQLHSVFILNFGMNPSSTLCTQAAKVQVRLHTGAFADRICEIYQNSQLLIKMTIVINNKSFCRGVGVRTVHYSSSPEQS